MIKYTTYEKPLGLFYRLDNFFIHRTLHPGKIYPVKIIKTFLPKIGELIFVFTFLFHIHAPLLVNNEKISKLLKL